MIGAMDSTLGDAATLERIAQARTSDATAPCIAALPFHTFDALLGARAALGEQPFLVFRDGETRSEIAYADLIARVAERERLLRSLGVARGRRVATLFVNDPEVPITYFAAWSIGASVVPVNLGEDDERIAFVLRNSEACAALHAPEVRDRVARLRGAVHDLRWHDVSAPPPTGPSAGAGPPPEPPQPEDEALIVYTSGTTGAPKGVVLTQRNLLVDAHALARWHGIREGGRLMCVLPTHHVNGIVVTLVTPLLARAGVVLTRKFQASTFWETAAREGVEVVSVVPTLLAFLLEDPRGRAGHDLARFRHFICGAGPLTVELAARFEERFGLRVVHGYGLSETTCYSSMLPVELSDAEHRGWLRDHGFPSIGAPLPPNEMAIHDREGRPLAEGERGEIVIRGVNVMRGYYRRPEANAETFAHGWFRSGDEGFFRRGADGRDYYFITGRLKELIIRGGVNLSPFEIDEVLNAIPGVARGLAVGFENRWYGEEVGAYVMLEPGATLDEAAILRACREKLPFGKSPKVVVFGSDIPVTATGKYQRGKLVPLFEAFKDVQYRQNA
jgi:long-chain acyl-CoA synthetase